MKFFFIKYRWSIGWGALTALLFFFIIPAQEQYYLKSDLARLSKIVQMTMLSLYFLIVAIVVVQGFRFIKNIKDLYTASLSVFNLGIILLVAYFVFNPIMKASFLLANRAVATNEVNKRFLVSSLSGDSTDKFIYALQDGSIHELVWNKQITKQAVNLGFKPRDTLQVTFAKGLFGVYYLHDKNFEE